MLDQKLLYNSKLHLPIFLIIASLLISISFAGCVIYKNPTSTEIVISEISVIPNSVTKKDVATYFCYNLTEYFNTYKFYKISSEVYLDEQNQKPDSVARITKRG